MKARKRRVEKEKSVSRPSTVEKGVIVENYIKRLLRNEGILIMRIAGSKPFDLVGLHGSKVYLIEVKSGSYVPTRQLERQKKIAKEHNAIYITVTMDKQNRIIRHYYFPDGTEREFIS